MRKRTKNIKFNLIGHAVYIGECARATGSQNYIDPSIDLYLSREKLIFLIQFILNYYLNCPSPYINNRCTKTSDVQNFLLCFSAGRLKPRAGRFRQKTANLIEIIERKSQLDWSQLRKFWKISQFNTFKPWIEIN